MARSTTTRGKSNTMGPTSAGRPRRTASKSVPAPKSALAKRRAAAAKGPKPGRAAAAPKSGAGPKYSKDELRARIEKLERANVTLRAKARESARSAGESAARVAELEGEVRRLERKVTPKATARPASGGRKPRGRPPSPGPEHDPGDAAPPGVAVETPEPPHEEDQHALERLDELGPE